MNKLSTLMLLIGLSISGATQAAGSAAHESMYEPGYISEVANEAVGSGPADAQRTRVVQGALYDPAYLRALSNTPAATSPTGPVINHESAYDPEYLRTITCSIDHPAMAS